MCSGGIHTLPGLGRDCKSLQFRWNWCQPSCDLAWAGPRLLFWARWRLSNYRRVREWAFVPLNAHWLVSIWLKVGSWGIGGRKKGVTSVRYKMYNLVLSRKKGFLLPPRSRAREGILQVLGWDHYVQVWISIIVILRGGDDCPLLFLAEGWASCWHEGRNCESPRRVSLYRHVLLPFWGILSPWIGNLPFYALLKSSVCISFWIG